MTDIQIVIEKPLRDLAGRFAKASEELVRARRDGLRQLGARYVQEARKEAPKRSGKFAEGLSYRTYVRGDTPELRTYSPQPLGRWIIDGTPPHKIVARNAPALSFEWPGGPAGPGRYFFKSVNHPGTQPNPFHERAWENIKGEAESALRAMTRSFVVNLKGGSGGD